MRILFLAFCVLAASSVHAGTYQCRAEKAFDLGGGRGMQELASDYLGIRAYSALLVDAEAGTLSTKELGTLPGTGLVSAIGDKKNPDLVIAAPETGDFFFRMRASEPDKPFFLIDAYVVITGTCTKAE